MTWEEFTKGYKAEEPEVTDQQIAEAFETADIDRNKTL
jgi:hypothetical protein